VDNGVTTSFASNTHEAGSEASNTSAQHSTKAWPAGSAARMKANNPLHVVDGGGLIGAAFRRACRRDANLEFSSVGNHEFDKGSAELKRLQNGGCKTTGRLPDANSCK
jgi:hypothetical protein